MTPRQLRLMLGVKDRSTVYRWLANERGAEAKDAPKDR
jgi:hypothetical protein